MKKLSILIVLSTLLLTTSAFAECDPAVANAEFQAAIQKTAAENPAKLAEIQADILKLQSDLATLMQEGKNDEVCKAFEDITAKLK